MSAPVAMIRSSYGQMGFPGFAHAGQLSTRSTLSSIRVTIEWQNEIPFNDSH
jgi:hypothetical protein